MSFAFSAAVRRLAPVALAVLLTSLTVVNTAHAGVYEVRACDQNGINRAFQAVIPPGSLATADASCGAAPQLGMKVRNSVQSPSAPANAAIFDKAELVATAPAGNAITRIRAGATAFDDMGSSGADGWRAGVVDDGGFVWCGLLRGCAWAGPPAVPIDITGRWSSTARLQVVCALWTGCARDRVRAAATLRDVILEVRDDAAPALNVISGELWSADGWTSGIGSVSFDARDASGVSRAWTMVDGATRHESPHACDGYSMKPCPDGGDAMTLDTRTLIDGTHSVVIRAADGAGNVAERTSALHVDNTAPTISTPELVGGDGWRSVNAFELKVQASDGSGSGVRSIGWEMCRVDGTGCFVGSTAGNPSSVPLQAPGSGDWKVRLWAKDALRSGAKSGWLTGLRFDRTAPGRPAIGAPMGWISKSSVERVPIELDAGEQLGPSGLSGFAITRDGSVPGLTPTHLGERVLYDLGPLPEGITTLRARAVSGAGVASGDVAEAQVKVDRTPPTLRLTSAASHGPTWIRDVRITAEATDQAGLSGMLGASPDQPVSRGGFVEYHVDGQAPERVRGPVASITLPGDGMHIVSVRAFDAAGNESTPQSATYRVDGSLPSGAIAPISALDPRRIVAKVSEDCVSDVQLEYRLQGASEWSSVPARFDGGSVAADMPDDRVAAGQYDVRFRVTDCAGNRAFLDRWAAGGAATLRLPLRAQLDLGASIDVGGRERASATLRLGTAVRVTGALHRLDGTAVAGRRVEVQERIAGGDWHVRATRTTDGRGRIAATLGPGPSRRLRLVVAGNTLTVGATSRELRVAVPAVVTIAVARHALRNGQTLRFSGRIRGGHLPRKGRELELQGYNPIKGRWLPVRTQGLRANASGRWRTGYRFTSTVGVTVTYRFRIRVAPRPDHPFAQGFSRTVSVTVRG